MSDYFPQNLDDDIQGYRNQIKKRRDWLTDALKDGNPRDPFELLQDAREKQILLFQDEMAIIELFDSLDNRENLIAKADQRREEIQTQLNARLDSLDAQNRQYEERQQRIAEDLNVLNESPSAAIADNARSLSTHFAALTQLFAEPFTNEDWFQQVKSKLSSANDAWKALESQTVSPVLGLVLKRELETWQTRVEQAETLDKLIHAVPNSYSTEDDYQTAAAWLTTLWVLHKATDPVVRNPFKERLRTAFRAALAKLIEAQIPIIPANPLDVYQETLTGTPMPVIGQPKLAAQAPAVPASTPTRSSRRNGVIAGVSLIVLMLVAVIVGINLMQRVNTLEQADTGIGTEEVVGILNRALETQEVIAGHVQETVVALAATATPTSASSASAAQAATVNALAQTAVAWTQLQAAVTQAGLDAQATVLAALEGKSVDSAALTDAAQTLQAQIAAFAATQTAFAEQATQSAATRAASQTAEIRAIQLTETHVYGSTATARAVLQTQTADASATALAEFQTQTAEAAASATTQASVLIATAIPSPTPTSTPTNTSSRTPTLTPSPTTTRTNTTTSTFTSTATRTTTPTPTPTFTLFIASNTPNVTATPIPPTSTPAPPLYAERGEYAGEFVNMRPMPNTVDAEVASITGNEHVQILGRTDDGADTFRIGNTTWYLVELEKDGTRIRGWVHSHVVSVINADGTPASQESIDHIPIVPEEVVTP